MVSKDELSKLEIVFGAHVPVIGSNVEITGLRGFLRRSGGLMDWAALPMFS